MEARVAVAGTGGNDGQEAKYGGGCDLFWRQFCALVRKNFLTKRRAPITLVRLTPSHPLLAVVFHKMNHVVFRMSRRITWRQLPTEGTQCSMGLQWKGGLRASRVPTVLVCLVRRQSMITSKVQCWCMLVQAIHVHMLTAPSMRMFLQYLVHQLPRGRVLLSVQYV